MQITSTTFTPQDAVSKLNPAAKTAGTLHEKTAAPAEPAEPPSPPPLDATLLLDQEARLARAAALVPTNFAQKFGVDMPEVTTAGDRLNVSVDALFDGAVVRRGGPETPGAASQSVRPGDLLAGTPGGLVGADREFISPADELAQRNAANRELFGGPSILGGNGDQSAAEADVLGQWNQRSDPLGGRSPMSELENRFGTRQPDIDGDPGSRNLHLVSAGEDAGGAEAGGGQEPVERTWGDIAGAAAGAAVGGVTAAAKGVAGEVAGILGLGVTVLTANGHEGGKTDEVNGLRALFGGHTLGSLPDAPNRGRDSKTERTAEPHGVQTGPTQEKLDQVEAQENALVNPSQMPGGEVDRNEAASRILEGKKVAEQSVIRPSGEDAGQPPAGPIGPKDPGLVNPPPGDPGLGGGNPDLPLPDIDPLPGIPVR